MVVFDGVIVKSINPCTIKFLVNKDEADQKNNALMTWLTILTGLANAQLETKTVSQTIF